MELKTLSKSKIGDWMTCQLMFALKHVDRVKPDRESSLFAGIGHVVHHALARAITTGNHPALWMNEGFEIYRHELAELRPEHVERMNAMMARWNILEPITRGDEVHVEMYFWLRVDLRNQFTPNGILDLVVRRGDFYYVIDWKTVRPGRQPSDEEARRDPQLALYAIAVSLMFDAPIENVQSGLCFLDNSRVVMTSWTAEQAQRWLEFTVGVGRQIIDMPREHAQPMPGAQCRYCDFKSKCPPDARLRLF